MGIEFVEGKCCGDCAKCELPQRPRNTQGMQACAVANMLPMVYCTHDLLIEQNKVYANLLKARDEEIDELKGLVYALLGKDKKPKAKQEIAQPEESPAEGENPETVDGEQTEPITPRRIRSKN